MLSIGDEADLDDDHMVIRSTIMAGKEDRCRSATASKRARDCFQGDGTRGPTNSIVDVPAAPGRPRRVATFPKKSAGKSE